jgi:hypothetical protein
VVSWARGMEEREGVRLSCSSDMVRDVDSMIRRDTKTRANDDEVLSMLTQRTTRHPASFDSAMRSSPA